MTLARFICLLVMLAAMLPAARAQDACVSLDPLLKTMDTVHEIQLNRAGTLRAEKMTDLSGSLTSISLDDIYAHIPADDRHAESADLKRYIADLRLAPAYYASGSELRAELIVEGVIQPAVRREIARLQQALGCVGRGGEQVASVKQVESETSRPVGAITLANAAPLGSRSSRQAQVSSSAGLPERQQGQGRETSLSAWVLPAITTLIIIGCVSFWARPRVRRWRLREERRTCYVFVPVKYRGRTKSMTVVDYTPDGLRLKHDGRINRRRRISIYLDGQWVRGKIAWSNNIYAGVRLADLMTPEQIAYLSGETIADSAKRCGAYVGNAA